MSPIPAHDSAHAARRRFTLGATLLGIASVIVALAIAFAGYHSSIDVIEQHYHEFYLDKAQLLARLADQRPSLPDSAALEQLSVAWRASPRRPADEYICVVDKDATLLLHTARPETQGDDVGENRLSERRAEGLCQLRALARSGEAYLGDYISSAGEAQVAAFYPIGARGWLIGVHRSKAALQAEIRSHTLFLMVSFLIICVLLLPAALFTLFRSSQLSQRASLRAEAALRESERRLLDLARFPSENPYPVLRIDARGVVLHANPAALRLLDEGRWVMGDPAPDAWQACAAEAAASRMIVRSTHLHGDEAFTLGFVPVTAAGYVNVYGMDISEQRRLEAQFLQAQKMEVVGQLAGGVAHDFNNILQAILGYGELALDDTPVDGAARPSIHEMIKAGERARGLVNQLLAFSRRQVLEMEDLDLNEAIADLVKMLRRLIGEDINLNVSTGHELSTVHADRGQLAQILINLCVNARDAMPEGGVITIETKRAHMDPAFCALHAWANPGRYTLLSVSDTGEGMDQETLNHIFEPFFTTKAPGKGTGLGLSTVYGLIRQHGGLIHARSEISVGTTFEIYLPTVDRPVIAARDEIRAAAPRGGDETILLAEDDSTLLALSKGILESAGYNVLTASDGEAALRVFEARADDIQLAILDVVMPKLGGRAVRDAIHARRPEMHVIFASGYSTNLINTNFILDEGLILIQKPYDRANLLNKVYETLHLETLA